jgi:hypothetical protein
MPSYVSVGASKEQDQRIYPSSKNEKCNNLSFVDGESNYLMTKHAFCFSHTLADFCYFAFKFLCSFVTLAECEQM